MDHKNKNRKELRDQRQRCRTCGNMMTWAAQRVQYGRLRRAGFDHDGAIGVLPLCQKCLTEHLTVDRESARLDSEFRQISAT